jgi:hypothetical protein
MKSFDIYSIKYFKIFMWLYGLVIHTNYKNEKNKQGIIEDDEKASLTY